MGHLAGGRRNLRLVLELHLGTDDMVLRLGRAAHCGRHLYPRDPATLVLYRPTVEADLGHAEHRHVGHHRGPVHGGAGGVSGRPQHHAVAAVHPADCAADHCLDPLDQLVDLGAIADRDYRAGHFRGHRRHRDPVHRVLRQAAL